MSAAKFEISAWFSGSGIGSVIPSVQQISKMGRLWNWVISRSSTIKSLFPRKPKIFMGRERELGTYKQQIMVMEVNEMQSY